MADVTLVQGDTGPAINGTVLKTSDQTEKDLTNATAVRFQMRQDNDRHYTVDSPATVVDAELGSVRYEWASGDLSVAGDYICQWEITWSDGEVQTTNPPNTLTVRRQ